MKRLTASELAKEEYDVLIVGGGITGAVALRDAAMRGLKVALVEKNDFAWGTSSRSTKLLHGGLRYLEQFEFGMVREACRERELFLNLAPHLSHPRPFLYLQYKGYPEGMLKLKAGLTFYDMVSGNPKVRRHKMLNRKKLIELEPHLNKEGLKGCGYYFDFLTDDARLTIDTIKSGSEAGGYIANYMEVVDFVETSGRIDGVKIKDQLNGDEAVVKARQVINTSGPWCDEVRFLENGVTNKMLRPTKGVHIVLSKKDFPLNHAVFLRCSIDDRVVWPIPAFDGDLVYIGTTDTDYTGSLDNVVATDKDIDYLLAVANQTIPGRNLTREHIIGTWAGLRPLIAPEDDRNASAVSREHEIFVSPKGLLTICGGKLTTARVMGQQVIDKAVALLGEHYSITGIAECNTNKIPISGGDKWMIKKAKERVGKLDISPQAKQRITDLYGGNADVIAEIIENDVNGAADLGAYDIVAAEVRYAVQYEMAITVTDFFTRRAALFYWRRDGGLAIVDAVAKEMKAILGWDEQTTKSMIEDYRNWVAENRF